LAAKLEELTAALQRERADFQNFRKRVERENEQLKSRLGGDILGKFLPVLDDFQRAMDSLPAEQRESDWLKGFHLIFRKFQAIVEAEGVTEINPLGQAFDPNLHEAIGTDDDSPYESQQVSAVLQRGYRQGERVLRPAMVRVAS
jgi:molecular chaperone GrpE